jgi:hypothetical protein
MRKRRSPVGRAERADADPVLQLARRLPVYGAYRMIDELAGAAATVGEGMGRFARLFRPITDSVVLTSEGLATSSVSACFRVPISF